jgi:hypothetical protein
MRVWCLECSLFLFDRYSRPTVGRNQSLKYWIKATHLTMCCIVRFWLAVSLAYKLLPNIRYSHYCCITHNLILSAWLDKTLLNKGCNLFCWLSLRNLTLCMDVNMFYLILSLDRIHMQMGTHQYGQVPLFLHEYQVNVLNTCYMGKKCLVISYAWRQIILTTAEVRFLRRSVQKKLAERERENKKRKKFRKF